MLKIVRDFPVELIQFTEQELKEIRSKIESLKMNVGGANGLNRSPEQIKQNKLMGFLAEKAVYDYLREKIGTIVYQRETDLKNQIDIFCGTKTVEVRSSQVKAGIDFAIFGKKKTGEAAYHLVGSYTNNYKKKEIVKDYYIWCVFEEDLDHCYIVSGATKDMIKAAPLLTMIPKGKDCKTPTQYKALDPLDTLKLQDLIKLMKPSANETLSLAKQNKEDEFYTLYSTVEREVEKYRNQLQGKRIYCNCDDPQKSNFWKYFVDHYKDLKLAGLCSTYFGDNAKLTVYNGDMVTETNLTDTGSYDTEECITILDQADIVITNPPFSLFRPFIKTLAEHKKDFLVIGNQNASCTKDIFPMFQKDLIRYGYFKGSEKFQIPSWYETRSNNVKTDENGNRYITVEGIRWFTTLNVEPQEAVEFMRKYNPFFHKRYDNFNAIEVPTVKDIPGKYTGPMGVPISYLNVHDPKRYKLIGTSGELAGPIEIEGKIKQNPGRFYLRGKRLYERIVIQKIRGD